MEEAKLKMVIEGENRADKAIKEAQDQVSGLQGKLKGMEPVFKGMAVAGTAAFGAIAGAVALSVKQAIEVETIQNRLYQLLKTTNNATKEQVDVLLDQADALERVGVMSKENVIMAQSQLATFDLQLDTIKELTPAILDYVVAEKGLGATTEDVKSLTNGLAQALQGNFGSLTRVGFVLDDVTKKMISEGTEMERAQALVEVLNSTYKDFNITARDTAEGSLIVLQRSIGDISEELGKVFLPILVDIVKELTPLVAKITDWIRENPELTKVIVITAGALAGLVAIIGTLGLILPPLITGIGLLGTALTILTSNPVGMTIVAIGLLITALFALKNHWGEITEFLTNTWKGFLDWFNNSVEIFMGSVRKVGETLDKWFGPAIRGVGNIASNVSDFVGGVAGKLGETIGGFIPQTAPTSSSPWKTTEPSNYTTYEFNFNGDVSDIDTLQNKIMETLNRNATLKSFAGQ